MSLNASHSSVINVSTSAPASSQPVVLTSNKTNTKKGEEREEKAKVSKGLDFAFTVKIGQERLAHLLLSHSAEDIPLDQYYSWFLSNSVDQNFSDLVALVLAYQHEGVIQTFDIHFSFPLTHWNLLSDLASLTVECMYGAKLDQKLMCDKLTQCFLGQEQKCSKEVESELNTQIELLMQTANGLAHMIPSVSKTIDYVSEQSLLRMAIAVSKITLLREKRFKKNNQAALTQLKERFKDPAIGDRFQWGDFQTWIFQGEKVKAARSEASTDSASSGHTSSSVSVATSSSKSLISPEQHLNQVLEMDLSSQTQSGREAEHKNLDEAYRSVYQWRLKQGRCKENALDWWFQRQYCAEECRYQYQVVRKELGSKNLTVQAHPGILSKPMQIVSNIACGTQDWCRDWGNGVPFIKIMMSPPLVSESQKADAELAQRREELRRAQAKFDEAKKRREALVKRESHSAPITPLLKAKESPTVPSATLSTSRQMQRSQSAMPASRKSSISTGLTDDSFGGFVGMEAGDAEQKNSSAIASATCPCLSDAQVARALRIQISESSSSGSQGGLFMGWSGQSTSSPTENDALFHSFSPALSPRSPMSKMRSLKIIMDVSGDRSDEPIVMLVQNSFGKIIGRCVFTFGDGFFHPEIFSGVISQLMHWDAGQVAPHISGMPDLKLDQVLNVQIRCSISDTEDHSIQENIRNCMLAALISYHDRYKQIYTEEYQQGVTQRVSEFIQESNPQGIILSFLFFKHAPTPTERSPSLNEFLSTLHERQNIDIQNAIKVAKQAPFPF